MLLSSYVCQPLLHRLPPLRTIFRLDKQWEKPFWAVAYIWHAYSCREAATDNVRQHNLMNGGISVLSGITTCHATCESATHVPWLLSPECISCSPEPMTSIKQCINHRPYHTTRITNGPSGSYRVIVTMPRRSSICFVYSGLYFVFCKKLYKYIRVSPSFFNT